MWRKYGLAVVLIIQITCATFFVWQILISVLGIEVEPISWAAYELIELGAALGLILGVVLGAFALRQAVRRTDRAEAALASTRAAFHDLLEQRFASWNLTPAERDVAMFAIKGLTTAEIAALRGVSEGTIKAQTAAIYRKAEVAGRPQLLSLFIDDLMEDDPDWKMPQS